MSAHIALLRAVNVGGHGKVAMADLRTLFAGLGFTDMRTALQSGNVVFGTAKASAAVERRLEAAATKEIGLQTDFFVRSAKEWDAVIAANPFDAEAADDPGHVVVIALKDAPAARSKSPLCRRRSMDRKPSVPKAGNCMPSTRTASAARSSPSHSSRRCWARAARRATGTRC